MLGVCRRVTKIRVSRTTPGVRMKGGLMWADELVHAAVGWIGACMSMYESQKQGALVRGTSM